MKDTPEPVVALGASLFARRLTSGRTGTIRVRDGDRVHGAVYRSRPDAGAFAEETARLFLLLQGHRTRPLPAEQVAALRARTLGDSR